MKLASHFSRHWKSAAAGALLSAAAGLLVVSTILEPHLALLSFDLPFLVRADIETTNAAIIYMDEESAKALDQPWTNNLAWSRDIHARLIRRLVESRARAIVFDILFDIPTAEDAGFLDAIRDARDAGIPVVVGAVVDHTEVPAKAELIAPVPPFPALAALATYGLAERPDSATDKPRRHFPGFNGVPSIAVRAAQATSIPFTDELPIERWINFYGPAESLPHRNVAAALKPGQVPASFFSNKICFVGARVNVPFPGGKPADEWHTPYTRWGYGKAAGVDITASVYLNLARHDWLTRLSYPVELLLLLAGGAAFGLGLALVRPTTAVALSVVAFAMTAGSASWVMWQQHFWFSWLVLAGIELPVALAWSVLAYTRSLTGENRVLRQTLARRPAADPAPSESGAALSSPGSTQSLVRSAPRPADAAAPTISDHALLRCIGQGAYGEVWLARNVIGTIHAVKIIRSRQFPDSVPFEREFRGIQKFMPISRLHPGLVQILHAGRNDSDGFFYYVMEPADDQLAGPQIDPATYSPKSLAQEIKRLGRLPVAECVHVGLRLTAALDFLHSHHLIHRDLKPANIIFVRGEPKLADIGLVTTIATSTDSSFVGTLGFIPPEGPGQPAADVFSLGRVLYEACMGVRCAEFPVLPDSVLHSAEAELVLELNQIILKSCEESLSRRYGSAAQMGADLLVLHERIRSASPSRV